MSTRLLLFICTILMLGSCETKRSGPLDTVGAAPQLSQVTLQPSQFNSDSINVGTSRLPNDLLTITTTIVGRLDTDAPVPDAVSFSIISSDSLVIVAAGQLLDNGQGADRVKGDFNYSATASFQIRRVQIGSFNVLVEAETADGFRSNSIITPLIVFRGNHAPVLSDLVAPDSIKLGNQSQLLLLSVRASDADGLSDIAKVVFNSFRPDSSASGGNPFLMYDDGQAAHGDLQAGDGVFSLLVSLPSNTQVGTYRFEFQAFDRSSQASNVMILRLTVKP